METKHDEKLVISSFLFITPGYPDCLLSLPLSCELTSWSISDTRPRWRLPATLALCSGATSFRHVHGLQVIQVREDPVHSPVQDVTL